MPPKKKYALYMETTKKDPEDTLVEIQKLLKQIGVRDMLINYDEDGEVQGVSFTIDKDGQLIPFKLPANHEPLWKLAQEGRTRYIRNEQQARRVAWRQILRWIQAQIAMIEIGMVSADEIFLPYMMISDKQTVYDKYLVTGYDKYLVTGIGKLLGPGKGK